MMLPLMPLTQQLIDSAMNTLLLDTRALIGKRPPTIHGNFTLTITDLNGTLTDLVLNLKLVSPESIIPIYFLMKNLNYLNLYFFFFNF